MRLKTGMRSALFIYRFTALVLALALTAASIIVLPQSQAQDAEEWQGSDKIVWGESISADSALTLERNGRDHVILLANSSASFTWDEDQNLMTVNLENGGLVYSTLAHDFQVSVKTDFARVDSQDSSGWVQLSEDGSQLEAYALEHPSLLSFVFENEDLNALSVPTGMKVKVLAGKVTDTLARLRLTKLTKEFQAFVFANDSLPEDLKSELKSSKTIYSDSEQNFMSRMRKQRDLGPAQTGFQSVLSSTYSDFEEILTFLPGAEAELNESKKDKALIYALSNFLYGDESLGEEWLDKWTLAEPSPDSLNNLYSDLFFVLPGDALYPAKARISNQLNPHEDALLSLRREFQDIESLLSHGSYVEAQTAYTAYQEQFKSALDKGRFDDSVVLHELTREYFLLELLLRQNPILYSVESVDLLTKLEEKILILAGSNQDVDEERQAFVQSKLRFLENVFESVSSRKLSVDEATVLADELLSQAGTYLNSITSQVAVKDYFLNKLDEYTLSVQFINSPEFFFYTSFEDGLNAFRKKVTDLDELNAYLQSLRSGQEEETTISLDDARKIAEADLKKAAILFTSLESLGDASNRLFEIVSARTGGISFEARYDRESKILYDIVVGEVRFSTGLSLENAKVVIEKTAESAPPEVDDTGSQNAGVDAPSMAERVALDSIANSFIAAGLNIDDFSFTIIDLTKNEFHFDGAFPEWDVTVSGLIDLNSEQLSAISWKFDDESHDLTNGSLNGLAARIDLARKALE